MRFDVAIVGGGFSGTILAAQLARRGVRSLLIDGSGRIGKGVAYSTTEGAHLLNVRAEGMSAWADEPDDFAAAFASEGGERGGFAERRQFGRYLGRILDQAVAGGNTELAQASAIKACFDGHRWHVELDNGERVEAGALALAAGNQEPEPLRALSASGRRFIRNPWAEESRVAIKNVAATGGSVLLVGTGLTMIDLMLSLDAAGHGGKIVALSRRGLVPRAHADFEPIAIDAGELPSGSLRALLRWLRKRGAQVGWRAAIDSLRPHSQTLWQGLGSEQQRRFLRHARPWWDVHRHRIAPQIAQTLARMIGDGRLEVVAGRIIAARAVDDCVEVEWKRRGADCAQAASFAFVFNCTGPLHAIARTSDPLLRSLFDSGQIRADQLGIGLDVDARSRAGQRLWALGPLTKGCYWEIVAVPDIRAQAAAVAEDIARELGL